MKEVEKMKKRVTALLALAFTATLLLGACGGNSETETTNNDSGGFLSEVTNSKSEVLSEVLSTGKVIAYKVDSVDKAETPDDIYFFDNGKVTIIPGEEFGLTMGDFSKMSDSEIWSSYETVKDAYIEKYTTEMVESYTTSIQNEINDLESWIQGIKSNLETVSSSRGTGDYDWYLINSSKFFWDSFYDSSEEEMVNELDSKIYQYSEGEISAEEAESYLIAVSENRIALINADIEPLKEKINAISTSDCAVPFADIDFKFIIETDKSGNKVASEYMIYPTLDYEMGKEIPHTLYDKLSFAQGLTRDEVIYDSTYNCIATTGSGSFMTREKMDIDVTLDSEYVLIDLSDDELNELFKEEITARYE